MKILIVSEDSFVIDALLRSQNFFQENKVFYNLNNEEYYQKSKYNGNWYKRFYLKYKNYMKVEDKIYIYSKIYS